MPGRVAIATITLLGLTVTSPPVSGAAPSGATGAHIEVDVIAAGWHHTCALLDDGQVTCWGDNDAGMLGLGDAMVRGDDPGDMGDALPTVDLGTGRTATAIATGAIHSCARLDDGSVKCWGGNGRGQLGRGSYDSLGDGPGEMGDALPAVDLGTGRTATAIGTSQSSTCAVLDNEAVKCWGFNLAGQLGLGDVADRGDGPGEMGDALPAVDLGSGRTATAIDGGPGINSRHFCALLDTGQVKCWGSNLAGQLGLGDAHNRGDAPGEMGDALPAVDLGTDRTATAIAVGDLFTCALLDNGEVKCWGKATLLGIGIGAGAVGDEPGEMGDMLPSLDLGSGRTAVAIAAGEFGACAVLDTGRLKCWGTNRSGQLGLGDITPRGVGPGQMGDSLPVVDLGSNRSVTSVALGDDHACAVLDTGHVRCWGGNALRDYGFNGTYPGGQLGLGDTESRGDGPGEMGDGLPTVNLGGAPSVTITTPEDEATIGNDEPVLADFGCTDETAVATCVGDVADGDPIDRTVGDHTFTVTATDTAGNQTALTVGYTVSDSTDPTVTITTPADEATFVRGDEVTADYSCADDIAIASCVGDVADGQPIDTTTLGEHTFTVVATDTAGNTTTVTHGHTVTARPLCQGLPATVILARDEVPTAGADIILGTPGDDIVDGGAGDDRICGGPGSDIINGGSGHDRVFGEGGVDTLRGGAGNDLLDGGPSNDKLHGDTGADTLRGRDGADLVYGGSERDIAHGGSGNDRVFSQAGNDRLRGERGADTLDGGTGADTLDGGPQRDTCKGGPQRDSQTACEVRTGIP